MKKIFEYLAYFTLITGFGLVGLLIFWLIYPYKPLEFKNNVFEVVTPIVKRGEHVEYKVEFCKYMKIGGTVSRTFRDGIVYSIPELETNNENGCRSNIISVYVPKALPPGVFTIRTVYRYRVNPIRTVDVITETGQFIIE